MPARTSDWCIAEVRAFDDDTCFVLPPLPTRVLLIYLHGIVPPMRDSVQKTTFETVVARTAPGAGAAAIMPRGEAGLAPKAFPGWYGWPTTEAAYRARGSALAARLRDKATAFADALGVSFSCVYLAGSSSGAYFVAALAVHGAFAADGFGAMSGGAAPHEPMEVGRLEPKPFYIGFGTNDTVAPSARALAAFLERGGWPVRLAGHPFPHGAKEVYVDEAFAFWREHASPGCALPRAGE